MSIFVTSLVYRVIAGAILAAAIALIARRQRSLSSSGTIAAVIVGTICTAAGWSWSFILIVFFLTGTLLSRVGGKAKGNATSEIVEKGGPRDAWQVIANGGVFASIAVASLAWPFPPWQVLAAGAIATSSADTWATEIGILSRHAPRSIVGLSPVPKGTSGGVTWLGISASFGGSALIALVTFLMGWPQTAVCSALLGGFAGALADSLLGATRQAKRYCPKCGKPTERVVHGCGTTTDIIGGIGWMNNDVVNAVSSIGGAIVGAVCLIS